MSIQEKKSSKGSPYAIIKLSDERGEFELFLFSEMLVANRNKLIESESFVMTLQKENAVKGNRELMGATNPKDAEEGTIRKKYGVSIDKNSVHGSDSIDNAKIEIDFFFKD